MVERAQPATATGLNVVQLARAAHTRGLMSTANLDAVHGLRVTQRSQAVARTRSGYRPRAA